MHGISDHAYARALVVELHHAGFDARITTSEDSHHWPSPTLLVEEPEYDLVIRNGLGGLPWSRFHATGESTVVLESTTGAMRELGPVLPTDTGIESVVNAIKEVLRAFKEILQ